MPEPNDEPLQSPQSPDEYSLLPDEYPLLPDESVLDVERALPPITEAGETPRDAETEQFSLGELLGLVAVMAVLLSTISSIARWATVGSSPAGLAKACAAVFGFGALASLIVLALIPQTRRIVTLGWWALLGLYIVSAAATVLMSK
jgi:hypothetical protein